MRNIVRNSVADPDCGKLWHADFKNHRWGIVCDDTEFFRGLFVRGLNRLLLLGHLLLAGVLAVGWGNFRAVIIVVSLWAAMMARYAWLRWIR